jgi:P4 family phage/plasmid primase-like protien
MANPPSNFLKFAGTRFESYILPIIPANADLKPREDGKPGIDRENLGKIPGMYVASANAWVGFGQWSHHSTSKKHLQTWQGWQTPDIPIAIGMRTAEFPVVDIDSDDLAIAEAIHTLAWMHLGWSPVRCREESPRRVLCYKWTPGPKHDRAPVRKMRLAFTDKEGKTHVVEVLGSGQQVVIEGPHRSGKMHYWLDGKGLIDSHDQLVDIAGLEASQFVRALEQWVEEQGFTAVRPSLPASARGLAAAVKVDDPNSPHRARDMELLRRAIEAIDINDPKLDGYETWCSLFRAMWAACGGDRTFYAEHILPWLEGNPANLEDDMEAKLASFNDSQLGAEFVFQWAWQFGFEEGLKTFNGDKAEETFGAPPDDDGGTPLMAAGSGGTGGNGQTGPLPFTFTDNAVADTFAAVHPEWRYTPDQDWVIYRGGVYVPSDMVLADISDVCVAVGAPFRAQGPTQVAIDMTLNGVKKHLLVERKLRCHRAVHAKPADFDADPWMINTPDFIVDLRTGEFHAHTGQLMRQQSLVAPDLLAHGSYERAAPRFMAYLDFVSNGRDYVIPFLQRWGAYSLVGEIFDQLLLFILGVPGSGKSTFADILARISHTYGKAVSKGFVMRQLEKRTFELYQTRGKRGLFADETPKGATWDEILINSMLGGTMLSAEGKGRDFIDFKNVGTITITGNHKPAFITHSEESGIDRRLLLLELNKKIADHMPDNTRFPVEVVQEEGAAIMMWLVQGAMEGWQSLSSTGSFLGGLEKPLSHQTRKYRLDANPYLEWIKAEMSFDPEGDIDANDAIALYRAYEQVEFKPKHPERREAFRSGLEALGRLVGRPISYGRRTSGQHQGRYVFKGIRRRSDADNGFDPNAKIVDIFTRAEFKP